MEMFRALREAYEKDFKNLKELREQVTKLKYERPKTASVDWRDKEIDNLELKIGMLELLFEKELIEEASKQVPVEAPKEDIVIAMEYNLPYDKPFSLKIKGNEDLTKLLDVLLKYDLKVTVAYVGPINNSKTESWEYDVEISHKERKADVRPDVCTKSPTLTEMDLPETKTESVKGVCGAVEMAMDLEKFKEAMKGR